MSAMSGESLSVLRNFVAAANAQYREAGLAQYQMHVRADGSVTVPGAHSPAFHAKAKVGPAASASAGAASSQAAAGAAKVDPTGANVKRSGPAPKITDLQQGGTDQFKLGWAPVAGAVKYGIWQDGVLLGHVTDPSFAGQVAAGATGTIQVDAVRADGSRTALTRALVVAHVADGKLTFGAGPADAAAGAAATTAAAARAG
jgi:hypothetical protein